MKRIGRREFLRVSVAAVAGMAATACAATPEVVEVTREVEKVVKETVVVEKEVKVTVLVEPSAEEPPMLADRVSTGELPPLDERLPKNPIVVAGRQEIGKYGGTVRMIHMDPQGFVSNYGWTVERYLMYSDHDLQTLIPNVLGPWEVSEDGRTFTLTIPEGLKWSDGEPVTTEDAVFWWEDSATYTEISPSIPWYFRFGGEPMEVAALDDYRFTCTFAGSFGSFPAHLTRWFNGTIVMPKHYAKQYHVEYRPKAELDAATKEAGFDTWVQLYNAKNLGISTWQAVDNSSEYPQLLSWLVTEIPQSGLILWERNPYYWKLDQAGNQLPYFDRLRIDLAASSEIVSMKIIQGELDYVGTHDVSVSRYPLYRENEATSNYKVGDYLSCMTDRYFLYPNFTHLDPVMREIIQHPNFLKALNVAVNRHEINENIFYGLARMGQATAFPNSRYYEEAFGQAWAQYDPELADQFLDEMGLDERDNDGFRLRPDGKRLTFTIEHAGIRVGVATHQVVEMIATHFQDVGIYAIAKELQSSLYSQRAVASELDCGVWHGDHCTDLLFPIKGLDRLGISTGADQAIQPLWSQYYSSAIIHGRLSAAEGEEPPQWFKDYWELYEEMNAAADEEKRSQACKKVLEGVAERPMVVGLVLESPAPLIFNKTMQNLPRPKVPVGWDTFDISTFHPEAFFYE